MFQELYDALCDLGYEPRCYSGRYMYGEKCLAVELNNPSALWNLAQALSRCDIEIDAPKTDSLGFHGIIAYWPSIKWEEIEEAEED